MSQEFSEEKKIPYSAFYSAFIALFSSHDSFTIDQENP